MRGVSAPVITDGPDPESNELLAGYRLVDVESAEGAIEIAAQSSAAPGSNGVPVRQAIDVRQVLERPRTRGVTNAPSAEDLLRELAPQVRGVVVRRYGDFAAAEDPVQEALLAAATLVAHRAGAGQPGGVACPGGLPPADQSRRDDAPAPGGPGRVVVARRPRPGPRVTTTR